MLSMLRFVHTIPAGGLVGTLAACITNALLFYFIVLISLVPVGSACSLIVVAFHLLRFHND
jgi:hypothetical protein